MVVKYSFTSPIVCITFVRLHCWSCVPWRMKIRGTRQRHLVLSVSEAANPWTRRLPYQPTDDERATHSTSHLPFRAWCTHCVKGLARGWPHRSDDGSPSDIPTVATDFCFVSTESDDDVRTILAMKEKQFQSVGATVKSASEFCGGHDHW